MSVSHATPIDYVAVVQDLERRLTVGQQAFDRWAKERDDLCAAIDAIRRIWDAGQAPQTSLSLTDTRKAPGPVEQAVEEKTPNLPKGAFQGLTYREAVYRIFEHLGRPTTAPEVTAILYDAGYNESRKHIKWSVDGMFSTLRRAGKLRKVGDKHVLP
jgi:hypothetical protein